MTRPRLALGTAQLGLDYGVANLGGRPTAAECERILDVALELGVEYFDTAQAYGDSEALIGRFLRRRGKPPRLRIGTKLSRLASGLTVAELKRAIAARVDQSRRRLGVECLDDLLLHSVENLREYGEGVVAMLAEQRAAGRIGRIGVSVYDAQEASLALSALSLSVTQLPFSVFDQQAVRSGLIARLRSAGHELFARSALQQGLLVLAPERAEAAVPGSGRWLKRFHEVCAEHGIEPLAAAVGFAAARSGADNLVVGVESVAQARQLWVLLQASSPPVLLDALAHEFAEIPVEVRDPRLWPVAR